MAASTEKKQKLSRNYRGWRSTGRYSSRCSKNHEQETSKPMLARHRKNENQYSDEEKIARQTTALFSKLTPEKKDCLLPKIIAIYKTIDNQQKLETFLSVIFESATAMNVFQSTYIDIFTQLLPTQKNGITNISDNEFKQCVLKLCLRKFQKRLDKSNVNGNDSDALWDIEWYELYKKKALISFSHFIGKLTAKCFVDFAMSLKFINVLYQDEKNESNIEAICAIFTEIYKFISQDGRRVALKNAEMNTIDVSIKTHLLVYGYIHRHHNNNIPTCIVDFCIGYYDVDCYLFKYYQKLQQIGSDNVNYGMRIRMLIQNVSCVR